MPSTASTNVTISTILDLIGPTQSSLGGDDGQPPFDSVLNSPPSPPPPVSQPPEQPKRTDDSRPSAAARRDDNSRTTDSANNNTSNDSPEHNQSKSTSAAAQTETTAAHRDEQPPEEQAEKTDDVQQLIAQSLAGISAATAKTTAPEPAPIAEETAKTTDELAATDGKPKIAQAGNQSSTTTASQVQAGDPQAVLPASEVNAASAAEHSAKTKLEKATATKEAEGGDAAQTKSDPQLTTEESNASSDKPAESTETTIEPSLSNDKSSQSPDQKSSNDDKPQATNLDSTAVATSTPDTASVANPNTATPIVAPVAATTTPNNQSTTTDAANQNQTSAVTASGPRSRLPAEALAPATGTNNRRPAVEVDSTRLLTRVVRAFSAAQERDGEVHLRLAPPELGSLRLDIRVENGNLTAHMQTETDAARTAIIDNLPALRERLAEQGVRIERFDVDLMQRQPGGMPDQQNGRQPDSPEPTPRFVQPARTNSSSSAATPSLVSSVSGPASGLNVIV